MRLPWGEIEEESVEAVVEAEAEEEDEGDVGRLVRFTLPVDRAASRLMRSKVTIRFY
jgi:hypothetical protein